MGQKTHPIGFRLGILYSWQSKWYADKNYTELLHEDLGVRRHILKKLIAGTAIAGTILVSDLAAGTRAYALAMASLAVAIIGTSASISRTVSVTFVLPASLVVVATSAAWWTRARRKVSG